MLLSDEDLPLYATNPLWDGMPLDRDSANDLVTFFQVPVGRWQQYRVKPRLTERRVISRNAEEKRDNDRARWHRYDIANREKRRAYHREYNKKRKLKKAAK